MVDSSLIIKEQAESVFEEADMIEFRVNEVARGKRVLGKTVDEWINHFDIKVSRQADPAQVSQVCSDIISKLHDAYGAKGKLESSLVAYKMGYQGQWDGKFLRHALNKGRKTIPKKESLDAIADAEMGAMSLVLMRYEKSIAFFQSMIYKLNTTLESVKTIAMSNGTLRKAEMGAY